MSNDSPEEIDWPEWFNPKNASREEKATIKHEYVEKNDEPQGEAGRFTSSSVELPVAAIVSFAGEESHEFEAYGTDETDLTYKDDVERGDKVVLKSDAEDAVREARRSERHKILNKIEQVFTAWRKRSQRLQEQESYNGDKELELNKAKAVKNTLTELRDDLKGENTE